MIKILITKTPLISEHHRPHSLKPELNHYHLNQSWTTKRYSSVLKKNECDNECSNECSNEQLGELTHDKLFEAEGNKDDIDDEISKRIVEKL